MASELLGIDWGKDSKDFPKLSEAIRTELDDMEFGFKDLGRIKKALTHAPGEQVQQLVDVALSNANEPVTILPDNGHLYVKVETSKKDSNKLMVAFTGIGGTFMAFYDKEQRSFVYGNAPRARSSVNYRDEEESQFEIGIGIRI